MGTNPISGRGDFVINPFKPSVAFHIETSHLIYSANHDQMTGSYMKHNIELRLVSILEKT